MSTEQAHKTNTTFRYLDPSSYDSSKGKAWAKVDGPGTNYSSVSIPNVPVHSLRGLEHKFNTDNSGFSVFRSPAKEKSFTDESLVRNEYYAEVDTLLKKRLPGVHKVFIFDHTIRRRLPGSPRQPVQQVHVDQTPEAARARVRRHLPADEVDSLLSKRFQLINVWRPIGYAATDFPLAVIDWRSTTPKDFVPVDLMYPIRQEGDDGDDRGKEICPDPDNYTSTEGYEVKGETLGVSPSEGHRFWYVKDMEPEEVMFLKCFDSWGEKVDGEGTGVDGIAVRTPHTAFVDPETPKDTPGRQSIEVRCLVFYE